MHELIDILLDIKNELVQMNEKLDNISGYYSISDVCDKIDDLMR